MKPNKLFNVNFSLLLQGLLVSQLGSTIYFVAIAIWIKTNTQSAAIMGLLGVATFLPSIIVGPIAGVYVDKWSRKKILVVSDLISGLLPLCIAYLMFFHHEEKTLIVIFLFVAAIVSSIASAFFRPAALASIPSLVPTPSIMKANALMNSTMSLSMVLGQSIAGVLLLLFSIPTLIFINGISFIISAITESFIKLKAPIQPRIEQGPINRTVKSDFIEGVRFFSQLKGLAPITIVFSSYLFFSSSVVIGLPYYVELQLNESEVWFGYLLASTGGGLLIGSILASSALFRFADKAKMLVLIILISGFAFIVFSLTTSPIVAALMLIFRGSVFGILSSWLPSVIQMNSPDHIRGRVISLFSSASMAAVPLGYILAGVTIDWLNHNTQPIYFMCGLLTILTAMPLITNGSFKHLMQTTSG